MRLVRVMVAVSVLVAGAAAIDATPASAFCSVHHRRPCILDYEFWIGQDLRLTIESHATVGQADGPAAPGSDNAGHELNTLREMFDALRRCWIPPPLGETPAGLQMSVRFAFKRSGEIMAEPRVTYTTPGTPPEIRERYLKAITEALARCTPLPLSPGLAGAIAGRPIAIRFIDNRIEEGQ
jgi:hypothetical protein